MYRMNLISILYEDEEIYVINKPAGVSVQGGKDIKHPLDEEFAKQVGQKVYLVHRLDKDTAGIMIIAKNPAAASKWTKLISSKIVKKEYVAVCAGKLPQKKGIINDDLVQHGQGKSAVTHYSVEKEWNSELYENVKAADGVETGERIIHRITMSKVRLVLETGRMHQIRIHLAKQNCPIAGDDQHGNFKLNKLLKKNLKIKQLLLCSVKLTLPLGKKDASFEVELPEYMEF